MSDRELTQTITDRLLSLPAEIQAHETMLAGYRNALSDAKSELSEAELEAQINCNAEGKNAETRKLQLEKAVNDSRTVKEARTKISQYEGSIMFAEAEYKGLVRQWQAALALAELQSAKINFLAKSKEK